MISQPDWIFAVAPDIVPRTVLRPRPRPSMPTFDIKFHDDDGVNDIFGQGSSTTPLFLDSPVDRPVTPPQRTQVVNPAYSGSSEVDIPQDSNPWVAGRKNNFTL
jgi:hypothetical protein